MKKAKMDRQGVRKAADLEQKYPLGILKQGTSLSQLEQLSKLSQTLAQFMASTNDRFNELEQGKNGVSVQTWFGVGTPTLENPPASDWSEDELKAEHIGDIYYDEENGKVYLFKETGWVLCFSGTALEYTVTFKANDEVYEVVSVKAGNSINAPATNPTSESGSFVAWMLNEEAVVFPYKPTSDVELTASFK